MARFKFFHQLRGVIGVDGQSVPRRLLLDAASGPDAVHWRGPGRVEEQALTQVVNGFELALLETVDPAGELFDLCGLEMVDFDGESDVAMYEKLADVIVGIGAGHPLPHPFFICIRIVDEQRLHLRSPAMLESIH